MDQLRRFEFQERCYARDADSPRRRRVGTCACRRANAGALKLALVCLLTAVGVPMIFAGDEFADAMDFDPAGPRPDDAKQADPLDLDRLGDPWRRRRSVPPEWVGREPIFRWGAKVYTLG